MRAVLLQCYLLRQEIAVKWEAPQAELNGGHILCWVCRRDSTAKPGRKGEEEEMGSPVEFEQLPPQVGSKSRGSQGHLLIMMMVTLLAMIAHMMSWDPLHSGSLAVGVLLWRACTGSMRQASLRVVPRPPQNLT